MRQAPLLAALGCLLVIPTTLVLNSCTPGFALKDYPNAWAKLERLSASNNCSEVRGTYLDEGTADDGTWVSLHDFLYTHRIARFSTGIVKLRFDKSNRLEVEVLGSDQPDKRDVTQAKKGWKCTDAGIKFHEEPQEPWDETSLGYNLYLLKSTDGALVIREIHTDLIGHGIDWGARKRSWYRFPSAE